MAFSTRTVAVRVRVRPDTPSLPGDGERGIGVESNRIDLETDKQGQPDQACLATHRVVSSLLPCCGFSGINI